MPRGAGGRGGGTGRRGRGRGSEGGPAEDQYGERFQSQDRDQDRGSGFNKGGTGGGEGGSASMPVSYTRHVPKFLQAHAHLLGKGHARREEEPQLLGEAQQPEPGSDSEDDQESLQRALEEHPELAATDERLQKLANKTAAERLKQQGNDAFKAGRHEEAIKLFTDCLRLDPSNEVFFSNRAAARIALKQHAEAVQDALAATKLKPGWAKGWARLGAAFTGLEDHTEAVEAYQHAQRLEPDDQQLQQACHRAQIAQAKMAADRKHKFKARPPDVSVGAAKKPRTGAAPGSKSALSFAEDDEDE